MAQMNWFKVSSNVFDDAKIKIIKHMPNGRSLVLIWFELLALAGKEFTDGYFFITDAMPITEEMLATAIDEDVPTVRLALSVFEKFGMVELINGNTLAISNWGKYQALDKYETIKEQNASRARKHRAKKKQKLLSSSNDAVTLQSRDAVTLQSRDVTQEKEKEKEKENREESREEKTAPTSDEKELMIYYQQKLRHLASSVDAERLESLLSDYGLDLCKKAIDRAVIRGKSSIRYVEGILKRWQQDGYDDPEDKDDGRFVKARTKDIPEEIKAIPF